MDKKFLLLALCLVLCGCMPIFHSYTQVVDLTEFHKQNPDTKIYYDDEEQTDKVELFRSWFDKELVIKKEGFEDYHVKLESEWTGDIHFIPGGLFFCAESVMSKDGIFVLPFCVIGTTVDIVTGVVSLPISYTVNPWKEYTSENVLRQSTEGSFWTTKYNYYLKKNVPLEANEELKKSCNKEGYFISNLGCTKCSYEESVVALEEESDKCSNRFYDSKKKLSYSCFDTEEYIDVDSCGMCKNRKMFGKECVLNCSADKPLQDLGGHCHSCDEEYRIETKECNKCKNRRISDGYCTLNCPTDRPLQDVRGRCYSCDEGYRVKTNECAKCPNRYTDEDNLCRLCEGTVSKDGKSCIKE